MIKRLFRGLVLALVFSNILACSRPVSKPIVQLVDGSQLLSPLIAEGLVPALPPSLLEAPPTEDRSMATEHQVLSQVTFSQAFGADQPPGLVVEAQVFVFPRSLWEPEIELTGPWALENLDSAIPLDRLSLPQLGNPIDGYYPGEPGYPLIRWTSITIETTEPLEPKYDPETADLFFRELANWQNSIVLAQVPWSRVHWIGAVGDIMVQRGVTWTLDRPNGMVRIFGDVLPILAQPDLLFGNLEGAVTSGGQTVGKRFSFRFAPRTLGYLEEAGFDYLSVVNNHSWDYGLVGFTDTLKHFRQSSIGTSGAGMDIQEASTPWIRTLEGLAESDGLEVRALSVGSYPVDSTGFDGQEQTSAGPDRPGVLWHGEQSLGFIETMASDESFDVVMIHGGYEWFIAPVPAHRRQYRGYIDAGADLVIGSHSHVVQGIEAYQEGLIAHSMGNFIFPGMQETEYGEESLVLMVGVQEGAIRYIRSIPVRIDGIGISIDRGTTITDRFFAATKVFHLPN